VPSIKREKIIIIIVVNKVVEKVRLTLHIAFQTFNTANMY
jgi:hypothetical protein